MDAGGLAQMSANLASPTGLGMPGAGLASRRAAQNIKPLSFDTLKSSKDQDGAVTPRTSRSHLLAGLRTAPKTSTATNFPASPTTTAAPSQHAYARNNMGAQDGYHHPPMTALPFYGGGTNSTMPSGPHMTVDHVLAPPEIHIDDGQGGIDPNAYAQMVYLSQQQQQLQQQLMSLQQQAALQQQFQQFSLSPAQQQQQVLVQQLHLRQMQQQIAAMTAQQNIYTCFDPATGQQMYYVDPNQLAQLNNQYVDSSMGQGYNHAAAPTVQVSPPTEPIQPHYLQSTHGFRAGSPPKRYDSPAVDATPLPPPSANAFRRGHKKVASLANINSSLSMALSNDAPKSAGPRTSSFPQTPGGYGPGQARAGEHPIRQPRGPPSMDELVSKPTAKHEGSKNFAARTRRSAVHNLVRAGLVRRNGTSSTIDSGPTSPVSETVEEPASPVTDESDSDERSGSGSLAGDIECSLPSSRSSASSTWGAIGSDRPSSRQKSRQSVDSVDGLSSENDGTFANVFKNGAQRASKENAAEGRKGAMLVLTKNGAAAV